jgi:hypothetical protein
MQSKQRTIWIVGAVLLILILLILVFRGNRGQAIDWRETYDRERTSPYGTSILYQLLEAHYPEDSVKLVRDSIKGVLPTQDVNGTYWFTGEGVFMDSADQQQLLQFVEAGNTAFLSSKSLPSDLMEQLMYDSPCSFYVWEEYGSYADTSAELQLDHPNLRGIFPLSLKYRDKGGAQIYYWSYLEDHYSCDQPGGFVPIGHIALDTNQVNFFRQDYGAGYFYFHTTPLAFSNMVLLEEDGVDYLERVLGHFDADGPLYWDAYSKVPEWMGRRANNQASLADRSLSSESPLSYILSQPPLAWAWYLLIAMGLIFLVFRAKRRQRIVPVLEPNTNTSLEFLSTIGRLYFLQNNHRKLALLDMRLFLSHIRHRYGVQTQELNEAFVKQLSAKSEVPAEHLEKILTLYRNIDSSTFVSSNTLEDFHRLIDGFYQKTN